MAAFLGIDAGTTALKAALFDETGRTLAVARREYRLSTPAPQWVELDPEVYWQACCAAVSDVLRLSGLPATALPALAISSQGETLITLDAAGRPLRPAIVWLDNRATAEAAEIAAAFDAGSVYHATGQPTVAPTWPACKMLWLRRHEPDVFAAAAHFVLVEDYLLYRLTGRYLTERCLQSSSLLLDIGRGEWWEPMLRFIGVDKGQMGELRGPGEAAAPLTQQAAAATGLAPGALAVTGGLDQAVGALGAGNLAPGIVTETTGGALAILATLDRPRFDPLRRVPCHYHAVAGRYCLLPWAQTAGMALRWFRDEFFPHESAAARAAGQDPYDLMTALAAAVPPGSDDLLALPHLEGAACPEFNPAARAVVFGATLRHTRGHFVRALMEAVAYTLARNLAIVEELGVPVCEVRSLGGGARSPLWLQIKADVLQKPVVTVGGEEEACLGAAVLAALAAGAYPTLADAVTGMVRRGRTVEPRPALAGVYREGYARYLELYERLEPMFR